MTQTIRRVGESKQRLSSRGQLPNLTHTHTELCWTVRSVVAGTLWRDSAPRWCNGRRTARGGGGKRKRKPCKELISIRYFFRVIRQSLTLAFFPLTPRAASKGVQFPSNTGRTHPPHSALQPRRTPRFYLLRYYWHSTYPWSSSVMLQLSVTSTLQAGSSLTTLPVKVWSVIRQLNTRSFMLSYIFLCTNKS